MDLDRLRGSPVGMLVPFVAPHPVTHEMVEGTGFLPDSLPADIELTTPTWTAVNAATAALARLDGAARLIPNPRLLRRPALRREAQSTSALEGTYAPFAEVLAADPGDEQSLSAEMREILNFERMAELAFSWPEDRPLTLGMLGELQRTLVAGTAGERRDTGRLREDFVAIGARGQGFDEARFVPSPFGDQLRAGAEDLLRWIETPPDVPTVVQAAMTHYQFETLHPYSDGNGRLGRLLIIVQLLRGALIREPLLVVSPWFEARREGYQGELFELSCYGDWDRWIAFFARGVMASAVDSQKKVEALVAVQDRLRTQVQKAGKRGVAERLAADLVGNPFVTRRDVIHQYSLSGQGATNAITTLAELGVLRRSGFTSRGAQVWLCQEVLDIAAR